MSPPSIPDHVHRFVMEHIHSVEQLEVLLLLRAQRERGWTALEVAKELRIAALSAGQRLADLAGRELLTTEDAAHYRYAPGDPALTAAVDALAQVYPERRVTIIQLIFSRPSESIRTFADAFKLRRDK